MGRDVGGGGGSSVGRRGAAWTTLAVLGGQATRLTPWNGIEIRLSSFARYNLVRFASIPSSYFSAAAAAADSDAERRPRISRVKHTNTNTTHTRGRAKKQKKTNDKNRCELLFFFYSELVCDCLATENEVGGGGGGWGMSTPMSNALGSRSQTLRNSISGVARRGLAAWTGGGRFNSEGPSWGGGRGQRGKSAHTIGWGTRLS